MTLSEPQLLLYTLADLHLDELRHLIVKSFIDDVEPFTRPREGAPTDGVLNSYQLCN